MTELTVADASGKTITMLDFDGFKLSFFGHTAEYMRDVYKNLPNFEFREDDVFLASYPKAGSVWTFEILTMLLADQLTGHTHDKTAAMLEARDQNSLNSIPSPRILNSHLPFDKLPQDLIKKKLKTVYVIRNYKDITVSFYNFMKAVVHYHYDGEWADWLQLHLDGKLVFGEYFRYVRGWEEAVQSAVLPVHVIYYEDLKSDTLKEIKRLAKFLGVNHTDSFLEEISANCQFDVMKSKYTDEPFTDSVKFKHGMHFFRKGHVGDWKNWYTVAQNDMVNEIIRTRMDNYKTSIHFGGKYKKDSYET